MRQVENQTLPNRYTRLMNTVPHVSEGTASLLRELRDRDCETGLLTASRIYRALLGEIARTSRYGNPLSCVLVQLRGLADADPQIRLQLASRLADGMRNTDFAGIWDEEEFLLVLPETDEPGARRFVGKVEQDLTDLASRLGPARGVAPEIATRITTWREGDDAGAMLKHLETRTRA